jgi:hypothetical protein
MYSTLVQTQRVKATLSRQNECLHWEKKQENYEQNIVLTRANDKTYEELRLYSPPLRVTASSNLLFFIKGKYI